MKSSDATLAISGSGVTAGTPTSPARTEWRAGWSLVAAATAGMSLASVSTYSIGVMIPAIETELGWSRALITSGPAIVSFVAVALSAFMGMAIDRIGARPIGVLSATLLCGALALMSVATSNIYLWWLLWGMVGLAASAMPTVWTAPILNRFSASRGLALAITLSGTGIGASLVPLIAGYCVEHYGWRTGYLALGVIWALLSLPLIYLFFRDRPTEAARHKETGASDHSEQRSVEQPSPQQLTGLSVREGFRSPAFYKLAFAAFAMTLAGTALMVNLVPVLSFTGVPRMSAIAIAGVVGICTIAGRICGGYLMDKYSAQLIAVAVTLATLVLPATLLAFPGSTTAAAIAVTVFALTAGPKMSAVIYLVGRHLGQRSFGTLFGTIHVVLAFGVGLGPLLANYIYDRTQSYDPVLWAVMPVLLAVAVAFMTLGPSPDMARNEERP